MEADRAQRILRFFEVYLKSNRAAQETINTYMVVARKFLDVSNDLTDDDYRVFQANNYGQKNNTALRNYYALAALFKSQNVELKDKAPPQEDHPSQPTINPDDMKRLILAVKAGGNSIERGLLALSSVYGMRRKELANVKRDNIDFIKKTITIRAVKHGRERTHLIPDCVFDHITNYDFKSRYNVELAHVFWGAVRKAGLTLGVGYGWHSIRRALYQGFKTNLLDFAYRYEFMRWRMRGMDMDGIYGQIDPATIDREAFEKHPFLKWWL